MVDLQKIIDDLSQLTVLEAADLAKRLEETWRDAANRDRQTKLFNDRERTRTEPLGRGESLFEFYDSSGSHGYNEFRSHVIGWLARMPAKGRDELITRIAGGAASRQHLRNTSLSREQSPPMAWNGRLRLRGRHGLHASGCAARPARACSERHRLAGWVLGFHSITSSARASRDARFIGAIERL